MHDDVRDRNDRFDKAATDAAALAVREQLKRCLEKNPGREIRKLGWAELRHIAIGAVGAYIVKRNEQRTVEEIDDLLTHPEQSPLQ